MPALDDFDDDQLAETLKWLAAEPKDDYFADLDALGRHFAALPVLEMPVDLLQDYLEQFSLRALDVAERFRPLLLDAALPLSQNLYSGTRRLVTVLMDISEAFFQLIQTGRSHSLLQQLSHLASLDARALRLLSEAYMLACMSGSAVPVGLWQRASGLAIMVMEESASRSLVGLPEAAAFHYKRMLLIAAMKPESLTAREIAWVFDYLEPLIRLVDLSYQQMLPERGLFWIAPTQDRPPVAYIRGQPSSGLRVLYFQTVPLLQKIGSTIDWLEQRIHDAELEKRAIDNDIFESETSGFPLGLMPHEVLSLLRRIRDYWRAPPSREHIRQKRLYTVEVCHGLTAIWHMLSHRHAKPVITEWTLRNESTGGFAIHCDDIGEMQSALSAGMALALRRNASQPWSICVVRRIRSDTPDQVELGLQVVSRGCVPISIGFRGGSRRTTAPALMLPPMLHLRHNQAVLAPAGTYTARRFILVRESSHLYIAQCRVLSLDMQTPNLELFQYAIDPYPI